VNPRLKLLHDNIRKVIIGKDDVVKLAVTGLVAGGHLLIEDAPGLGKTMLARAIAQSIRGTFKRIQFTPDLLPSDVTGVTVFDPTQREFQFHPGPVFAHVVLADEINRTSPRTQSSLLECMEERQVTVDGRTRPLPEPFFVIATQNPVELDGTYPLPEAQLDRFLLKIELGYPRPEDEVRILTSQIREHPIVRLEPVLEPREIIELQAQAREIRVAPEVLRYVVDLIQATRKTADARLGVSPRGTIALMRTAQAHALLNNVRYVTPDSVKAVAPFVLSHRLLLDPQRQYAGLSQRKLIERLLNEVSVPVTPEHAGAAHEPT
jgi:MoxR-like ATPase